MNSQTGVHLSVVIPAYNEEERLGETLGRISRYLDSRGMTYEIIVVDDGSTDGTTKVAESHPNPQLVVARNERNLGKGAAVRKGVLQSLGNLLLICDADLSTPIEDLEKLETHIPPFDLALGSRSIQGSQVEVHQPFYREFMGRSFNLLIRCLGVRGVRDTQCGFKLLRGETARTVFKELSTRGFAFDVELVWLAQRAGLKVQEVGVVWRDSPNSKVRVWIDPLKMLLDIARFRWRHRRK